MAKFIVLYEGFEQPTEELMEKWVEYFDGLGDRITERAHLPQGLRINKDGSVDSLPLGADSMTGFIVMEAADLTEAEALSKPCPVVKSIYVYEMAEG